LLILVVGLVAAKMLTKWFRRILNRSTLTPAMVSTVTNVFYVVLFVLTLATAMAYAGVQPIVIRRILLAISLAAAGLIIVFRPLIPTLPFKVGNTIKTGALLGKVEAITVLNTRLKTFDGKTVSVPNTKILNDYVINFHATPTRRFELEVGIGYDQDILKAKQVLEAIMIEDPRVITKPRPVVYVANLADSCVELSGRGWVNNLDYWKTKCDLLEKTKLRFDQEGITIAFPQRDVHLYYETAATASPEAEHGTSEKGASEPKARKGSAYSGRERHTKRHQATKN
jgi:small conductance mechanosensitive channel